MKAFLECGEDTKHNFNSCGIEVLPFIRPVLFDMDNDGIQDLIAGSKDGTLRLYKNYGTLDSPAWCLAEKYFDGITAGAFSAPAIGDIDNDGRPEIGLGTGGFSSESGRVIFFRNTGSIESPVWEKILTDEVKVGNDATPTLYDVDDDGKPDLIVGNSSGNLFLFRNQTKGGTIRFRKDTRYFRGLHLGLYVVPAVTADRDRLLIVAGNSMGKLHLLEKKKGKEHPWQKTPLDIATSNFASPTFVEKAPPAKKDLVIADGDGQLYYFQNMMDYRRWESYPEMFGGRLLTGPASTPSVTEIDGRFFMVVGNLYGEIKLFEHFRATSGLPWVEKPGFFETIKLPGFSRGVFTKWKNDYLLITGQQNGLLRAFVASGNPEHPSWEEKKEFFRSIPKTMHAAPFVFDIDNDGRWELVVGDADGYVHGYHYDLASDGIPVWKKMDHCFKYVKVGRFATPSIFEDSGRLHMLAGQQDGRIKTYISYQTNDGIVFYPDGYLQNVQVNNHSSPSVTAKNGIITLAVGDYDGNLKHYACRKAFIEITDQ